MDPAWVSAAVNGVLASIWLVYLTLFYRELKSNHKIRLFVLQDGGYRLSARCQLVNLSEKAVSLSSVQICLNQEDRARITDLTGTELPERREGVAVRNVIDAGESATLGRFDNLLAAALGQTAPADSSEVPSDEELESIESVVIRLAIMHGGSDHPAALQRTFVLDAGSGEWLLAPSGVTVQWTGRRGRRLARDWIRANVEHRGIIDYRD